jgi:hypothetical protein
MKMSHGLEGRGSILQRATFFFRLDIVQVALEPTQTGGSSTEDKRV